jgi:hypothetical protein
VKTGASCFISINLEDFYPNESEGARFDYDRECLKAKMELSLSSCDFFFKKANL